MLPTRFFRAPPGLAAQSPSAASSGQGHVPPVPAAAASAPLLSLSPPTAQMQAPAWLMQQFAAIAHRPASRPSTPPSDRGPVPAWLEGPSAELFPSQAVPHDKPREQVVHDILQAALSHFSVTWDAIDSAAKRAAWKLAVAIAEAGGTAGVEVPLHAAILKSLAQRRKLLFFIDPERFIHPEKFNPYPLAGHAVFGAITINAAHRDQCGTLKYYLERQPDQGRSSAQHACNAMVGGPVVSLGDFAEHEARAHRNLATPEQFKDVVEQITRDMLRHGTSIETVRAVLKEKIGVATRLYRHDPAAIPDGPLNLEQAFLLDEIDTDRLFLQCVIPDGDDATLHAVAFRKDNKRWTLLDSRSGRPWEGMTPSLYLEMQEAIGFDAIWPQRGLASSGALEVPLDAEMAQQAVDEAWLAGRLGLEADALHFVIPEWDGKAKAVRLWREPPPAAALQGARVQPMEIPSGGSLMKQLGGEEGRRLYAMLMRHQLQHQAGAPEDTDRIALSSPSSAPSRQATAAGAGNL